MGRVGKELFSSLFYLASFLGCFLMRAHRTRGSEDAADQCQGCETLNSFPNGWRQEASLFLLCTLDVQRFTHEQGGPPVLGGKASLGMAHFWWRTERSRFDGIHSRP